MTSEEFTLVKHSARFAKKTPLWLLMADRYIAEIAAAERARAERAAAARRLKAALSRLPDPPRLRVVASAEAEPATAVLAWLAA